MKIRTKLILITALPVVLALVVGVILTTAALRLRQLMGPVESARDEVVTSVFELSVLTHEYVQRATPRVREQWQARHASLQRLLETAPFPTEAEPTRANMRLLHRELGNLFERLTTVYDPQTGPATDPDALAALRARRVGQLLTMAQQLVSVSADVGRAGERERAHVLQMTYLMLLVVVMLTAAGLAGVSVLVSRSVTRPIARLRRGTELVARGRLDERINSNATDEIGDLAREFDRMTGTLREVTVSRDELAAEVERRRQVEAALAARNAELHELTGKLARSNEDLGMFAYAASHDLQEPLRAVAGFVQLLEKRYQPLLDDRGRQYIAMTVEATQRMQTLIHGLLDYSRVTTRGKPLTATDTGSVLDVALGNLRVAMADSHATVTHDTMPTVNADELQMTQLFQNLIGNALKFRGTTAPQIHIGAQRLDGHWEFSVRDNGIGIAPEYAERVFVIFQRLHTRQEYPGTGLGLALCKKIVERHGGRIWVESQPGAGATFRFTIPDGDQPHGPNHQNQPVN